MSTSEAAAASTTPILPGEDLAPLAEQVDRALAAIESLEPGARAQARAVRSAIEEFHRAGLTRIVRRLKEDPRGRELLFELVEEPAVYALFAMHGLVRADLRTRVGRVIEMVRPFMQSHGGDVSLVDVRDGRAFVALSGNCHGCSMSAVTLRSTVEESLKEHVPEITGVEVVPDEPGNEVDVVQIQMPAELRENPPVAGREDHVTEGWVAGPRADDVLVDRPVAFQAGDVSLLVIRSPAGLRAFRNACGHAGLPLERGICDGDAGTITCPWHGFQFDSETGECLTARQCQLEPFPLRVNDGMVWVRPA
jgi:nitrite reductase/ring-hydroxylating ferredoxin subunit/Fe-S cluster biogenesis protein NfuA